MEKQIDKVSHSSNWMQLLVVIAVIAVVVLAVLLNTCYRNTKQEKNENLRALITANVENIAKVLDAKAEIVETYVEQQTNQLEQLLKGEILIMPQKNSILEFEVNGEIEDGVSLTNGNLNKDLRTILYELNKSFIEDSSLTTSNDFFRVDGDDSILCPISFNHAIGKVPENEFNVSDLKDLMKLNGVPTLFKNIRSKGNNNDMFLYQCIGFEDGMLIKYPWNLFEDIYYDPSEKVWFKFAEENVAKWIIYKSSSSDKMIFSCVKAFKSAKGKAVSRIDISLHKIITQCSPDFTSDNNMSIFLFNLRDDEHSLVWSNEKDNDWAYLLKADIDKRTKEIDVMKTITNHESVSNTLNVKGTQTEYTYSYCSNLDLICVCLYKKYNS